MLSSYPTVKRRVVFRWWRFEALIQLMRDYVQEEGNDIYLEFGIILIRVIL